MSVDANRGKVSEKSLADRAFDHCLFPLAQVENVRKFGPSIFVDGEGVRLTDSNGNTYLDMMGTHTRANSLGYGNHEIAQVVYEQLASLHYVGSVDNFVEPTIQLAETIVNLAPGDLSRVLFVSGGSEAVESAIKLAKQYHINSGRKPRAHKVISRWNAYHGATMGALAATDWLGTRHISEPGVPGYSFVPGPKRYRNEFDMDVEEYEDFCATYLERQIEHEGPDYIAAFIGEPIMQANGVQAPSAKYLRRVRELCDMYDIVYIGDEVITGFGRTGEWFAFDHFDVVPDIMTMAKAITAGYMPMGAVITKPDIADALPIFKHVHTFSGHAGASAAANKVIEIKTRDKLVERSRTEGAYFLSILQDALLDKPIVGDVRGLGMWLAVEFTSDKGTKARFEDDTVDAIVRRLREKGVIVCSTGDSFELAPPFITSRSDLEFTTETISATIDEISDERSLG